MKNNNPEQELINDFLQLLINEKLIEKTSIKNSICRGKNNYADIEFINLKQEHWIIEAKSHLTTGNHNAAHLLFGELLKETGKKRKKEKNIKFRFGLLLSDDSFFAKKFQQIPRLKYIRFGKLIPITSIFIFKNNQITEFSWESFYDEGAI